MRKKNLLNGFKLEKLPEISNGLMIPVGNDLRPKQVEVHTAPPIPEPVSQAPKPKTVRQQPRSHSFGKLNIDSQAFTPMTNVVPTIEGNSVPTNQPIVPTNEPKFRGLSRRARQRVTHEDMNMAEYGALQTKQDKIVYLSLRGWSLKIERRGNALFHYATRYVNRKKKRLYIGAVSKDM